MYDENSGLVKVWASLIAAGAFNLDDVPSIYNLRDMVKRVVCHE